MFESLSEKLQSVFDRLGRKGRLSEEDVELALREVRVALLEADVSLKVVRQFVAAVKDKAVGQDVVHSLTPAQTVIKIVHDQLVELLGTSPPRLTVASKPPTVVMLVGLQGSGKTTTAGSWPFRSARWAIGRCWSPPTRIGRLPSPSCKRSASRSTCRCSTRRARSHLSLPRPRSNTRSRRDSASSSSIPPAVCRSTRSSCVSSSPSRQKSRRTKPCWSPTR